MRNQGSIEKYIHPEIGFNSRLQPLQAVVLSEKIKKLATWNKLRNGVADNYFEKFEGKIFGEIDWPGRGTKGQGYDPIFKQIGYNETFGEMDRWKKNKISHRGLAMDKLLDTCF